MSTPPVRSTGSATRAALDAVATHHLDGFRSGVARFNELLAERLGVPLLGLDALATAGVRCPLLSFKVAELAAAEVELVSELVAARPWSWEVYLHDFRGLELETRLVAGAQRVHCGSLEIEERVRPLAERVRTLWTPGLILDDRPFPPSEISVFSFGMAHKIRADMFRRLRKLLDATGRTYAVYVSAANHETASLRDSEEVFREMHEVFPDTLYFLGNLSDVAVFNYLRETTFFAAFFVGGVRANNTSVASALERGAVVITNLDEHSPPEFRHMDSVIDIEQCDELPSDPLLLTRLSARAMELGRSRDWNALVRALRSPA